MICKTGISDCNMRADMERRGADIRPSAHPVPQSSPKPGRWSWANRSLAAGAKNLVRVKPILAGVLKLIQEGALQSGHQAINCDRFCAKVGKVL